MEPGLIASSIRACLYLDFLELTRSCFRWGFCLVSHIHKQDSVANSMRTVLSLSTLDTGSLDKTFSQYSRIMCFTRTKIGKLLYLSLILWLSLFVCGFAWMMEAISPCTVSVQRKEWICRLRWGRERQCCRSADFDRAIDSTHYIQYTA